MRVGLEQLFGNLARDVDHHLQGQVRNLGIDNYGGNVEKRHLPDGDSGPGNMFEKGHLAEYLP